MRPSLLLGLVLVGLGIFLAALLPYSPGGILQGRMECGTFLMDKTPYLATVCAPYTHSIGSWAGACIILALFPLAAYFQPEAGERKVARRR